MAKDEVKRMVSQTWTPDADFDVLGTDGRSLGMRTHEAIGSVAGVWFQRKKRRQCRRTGVGVLRLNHLGSTSRVISDDLLRQVSDDQF